MLNIKGKRRDMRVTSTKLFVMLIAVLIIMNISPYVEAFTVGTLTEESGMRSYGTEHGGAYTYFQYGTGYLGASVNEYIDYCDVSDCSQYDHTAHSWAEVDVFNNLIVDQSDSPIYVNMYHHGDIDLVIGDSAEYLQGYSALSFILADPSGMGNHLNIMSLTYDIWESGLERYQGSDIRYYDNNLNNWVIMDELEYEEGERFVKDVWFELELSPGSYNFIYSIIVDAQIDGLRQNNDNDPHVWVDSAIYTGLTDLKNWVQFSNSYPSDDDVELLGSFALTTTVPIPAALWLLGSGLIGIVGIKKKMTK